MIRRTPRSTRTSMLVPYTTLFRSSALFERVGSVSVHQIDVGGRRRALGHRPDEGLRRAATDRRRTACPRQDVHGEERGLSQEAGHPDQSRLALCRALLWPSSEERRVGTACVSTCRSRWGPYH